MNSKDGKILDGVTIPLEVRLTSTNSFMSDGFGVDMIKLKWSNLGKCKRTSNKSRLNDCILIDSAPKQSFLYVKDPLL